MPSIHARDAAAFLEIVHDGARDARPDPFPPSVLSGLAWLIPSDAWILGWVARGRTNAEIGAVLFISPQTVRKHLENIFEKLGVRTQTAAAAYARAALTAQDADYGSGEPIGSGG